MSDPNPHDTTKKRYAVVGTGGRARGFIEGLVTEHADHAALVGFCDASPTRMDWYNRYLQREHGTPPIAACDPDGFEDMLRQQRVDTVVVTTTDATHHEYCVRAMEAGCDVVCEKPLTVDADKAKLILDAMDRTGRDLKVTFNARYNPKMMAVKRAIRDGAIGRPLAVDYRYVLDTRHGADYFRRWHATRAHSGGLLLHKSTHHFDLINWLLEDRPDTVVAMGDLKFYGEANARARGESYGYDRYTSDAPGAREDPFAFTLDDKDEWYQHLYRDAEADSGYLRDRNVFGGHVDIDDVMHVLVRYRGGVMLNYSLIAFAPWEGLDLAVTGTRGRVELVQRGAPHVVRRGGTGSESIEAAAEGASVSCRVYPMFAEPYDVPIPKLEGTHGGSDPLMREALFHPDPPQDPWGRAAGVWDGIASILCGIAANDSIAAGGKPVRCDNLIRVPDSQAVPA